MFDVFLDWNSDIVNVKKRQKAFSNVRLPDIRKNLIADSCCYFLYGVV